MNQQLVVIFFQQITELCLPADIHYTSMGSVFEVTDCSEKRYLVVSSNIENVA